MMMAKMAEVCSRGKMNIRCSKSFIRSDNKNIDTKKKVLNRSHERDAPQ